MNRSPLKLLVTFAGALSILVGAVVVLGWHTHNIKLIQINETFAPMQYNTALGFLLSGVALLLLVAGREWEPGVFGLAVLLIGGLTLIEYIGGVDLYLDQLFMKHYVSVKTSHPGRMAPNTAFCFSLIGFAALFSAIRPGKNLAPAVIGVLGALIFGLGVVALTGYFLRLEMAYGWGELTRMAIHTSVGVITLGIGFMALAWAKDRAITLESPRWLPIHIGMAGCTITVSLWQAIQAQEYSLIRTLGPESDNIADEGVLLFGVILSVALAFAIYQKQMARRQMEMASRANELYQRELTERKRVESEMRIARTIQMSFLPRNFPPFPMRHEIDLHAALEPAREVGGDFYDFFMLGKDQLFISVGDVSDKGIPAALFMAVTKSLMKGIAAPGMEPTELLERVNRELCQDNDALMFATVFCGILDLRTGELSYSNAGHNPPLLLRRERDPAWLELPPGLVLGVRTESTYLPMNIQLATGDSLMLYTDGATDALSLDDEPFSATRLFAEAAGGKNESAQQMTERILHGVQSHAEGATPADDITLLSLRYLGTKKGC